MRVRGFPCNASGFLGLRGKPQRRARTDAGGTQSQHQRAFWWKFRFSLRSGPLNPTPNFTKLWSSQPNPSLLQICCFDQSGLSVFVTHERLDRCMLLGRRTHSCTSHSSTGRADARRIHNRTETDRRTCQKILGEKLRYLHVLFFLPPAPHWFHSSCTKADLVGRVPPGAGPEWRVSFSRQDEHESP